MDGGLNQQLGTALTQNGYGQVLSTMFPETNALAEYLLYHLLRYRMTIHHYIISPHSVAPETPTHPTILLLMKTWMDSFSHVADMTVVVGRVQSRLIHTHLGFSSERRSSVLGLAARPAEQVPTLTFHWHLPPSLPRQ